jgi:hypothetical protein
MEGDRRHHAHRGQLSSSAATTEAINNKQEDGQPQRELPDQEESYSAS